MGWLAKQGRRLREGEGKAVGHKAKEGAGTYRRLQGEPSRTNQRIKATRLHTRHMLAYTRVWKGEGKKGKEGGEGKAAPTNNQIAQRRTITNQQEQPASVRAARVGQGGAARARRARFTVNTNNHQRNNVIQR